MPVLRRIWGIIVVVAKRLTSQPGLAAATVLGLMVSVSLIMAVPLYADAVYYSSFQQRVVQTSEEPGAVVRPPFTFLFRYSGGVHGSLQWEDMQQVDAYLSGEGQQVIGLPLTYWVRYFRTEPLALLPELEAASNGPRVPLEWASIGFISEVQDHITLLEGNFPRPADASMDSRVEVLVGERLAEELGLRVGESYIAEYRDRTAAGVTIGAPIPVRIAGIWTPTEAQEAFWPVDLGLLEGLLLVPEETFARRISPFLSDEIYMATWYMVMDGSEIRTQHVNGLLGRIGQVKHRAAVLLPNTRLDLSPEESLFEYRNAARLLTILLYALSVPIIGLILAFIGLVAGLSVDRRRNEIAVLRSRGATILQVMGMVGSEGVILGALALGTGTFLGARIASLMSKTRSFLDFTAQSDMRLALTQPALWSGLAAIGLGLAALALPAVGAARHTIVTYKRERARLLRPPWWQRSWLDVLLLVPAAYGAYLLRQQGSIVMLDAGVGAGPIQNPLLFLVPALGVFALTLLLLRLIPPFMAGVAWLASRTKSVGLLMAARQLSRAPGAYGAPLVLLVLTLSLSAYTASVADTLDRHLTDQAYYRTGADMRFLEVGERTAESLLGSASSGQEGGTSGPQWRFVPVSDYTRLPDIEVAARVGRYPASVQLVGGSAESVTFLGVDRYEFLHVSFWRQDFAGRSLGALTNELALAPDGVLISGDFMRRNALRLGDRLRTVVDTYGQRTELDLTVVGSYELFPTWYPESGALLVANLPYLFQTAQSEFPYEVWLKIRPGSDTRRIGDHDLRTLNVRILDWKSAPLEIAQGQERPERQGLFGLLSVGYGAAALLTVVGFLLYALFSFRRRFIELGVLRAGGLSIGQMAAFLGWELVFLVLVGGGVGTALGAWISAFFIPYLQVGAEASAQTPPFMVQVAWPAIMRVYALFGLLFLVSLVTLVILLRRMKIHQAIKLGETV